MYFRLSPYFLYYKYSPYVYLLLAQASLVKIGEDSFKDHVSIILNMEIMFRI